MSTASLKRLNGDSVMSCLEHQRLIQSDFAYATDFEYLIDQELPCFSIEVKRGQLGLRVGHYLAEIILPSGLSLEILPKISSSTTYGSSPSDAADSLALDIVQSRQWVATMLQDIGKEGLGKAIAAINLKATELSNSPFTEWPPLGAQYSQQLSSSRDSFSKPWYQGLLARINQVLQQAAKVLPSRYQTQNNNSPKAKGKIRLKAQLKNNWHRPHYLYTEQTVFETDKLLAEFLATAWQQLQTLSQVGALSSTQPLPANFQGVVILPPQQWAVAYQQIQSSQTAWSAQLNPVQANTIKQAIGWAWWLLTHSDQHQPSRSIANSQAQKLPAPSLMINMNHAFERWVLGRLQGWVTNNLTNSRLILQPSFEWLSQKMAQPQVIQKLIPDACIVNQHNNISHVVDVKYKQIAGVTQVSGADWQQLYVYQQHLNCENAWLIYPKTKKFNQRLDVFVNFNENRLSNQDGSTQMSVIPFDPYQGLLLI